MNTSRFLWSPKWLFGHVLVVAVLFSFTQFGAWQWRRHLERIERNADTEARLASPPERLEEALAAAALQVAAGASAEEALRFRRVEVIGIFEVEDEVLRRSVSRDGRPGYHLVTPLRLSDDPEGRRIWVERGWVPDSVTSVPVEIARPPEGELRVVGHLRATTAPPAGLIASIAPRDPPSGRLAIVYYLDPARLGAQVAGPLVDAVLWLDGLGSPDGLGFPDGQMARSGASALGFPLPPEAPVVSMGSHLGYAIQWYAFALITLVGYTALVRRMLQESAAALRSPASPTG